MYRTKGLENFVYFDFETRSCADLFKVGGYEYAMDPSTEITALGYAIGDERPKVWRPLEGDPLPKDLIECIEKGYYFVAHNAQFERIIWKHVLEKQGFPPLDESKILCTMVQAYTHGLQGSLEKCAKNLKLPQEKDMSGSRVMLQLAKPRSVVDGVVTWWEKEDSKKNLDIRAKYKTLYAYCAQDVIVTRNIFKSLMPLVKSEREMYALDQRINDFGVPVDREACKKLIKVADHEAKRINERLKIITGGKIKTVNQHTLLRLYINAQGVETDSLDKAHVEMLLEDDIPDHVREILELKKAASKSSVKKLTKMLSMSEKDGRARGTLQCYGAASTGRWAGRGIQFQNLPRPTLNQNNIESILSHVEENNDIPSIAEHIDVMYDNPMFAIASCIRGCVRAEDGKKFVAADFSAIEARVLAWLSGQEDVLEVFRTHGKIYEKAAADIYHVPMNEVTGDQRQIGKVSCLALGYGGGVGAFQSMAKIYGVKISDSKADDIKVKWRKANSKIVDYWYALENAAIKAVQNKGSKVVAGPTGREVCFKVVGNFLFCRLPSGRFITTPYPHLKYVPTPWGSERLSLFYYGEKEQKFIKMSTYGGKLAENITQAVSADLLRNSLVQCELADFPVTFHVHDEIVCELNENDSRTEKELEKCMEILPPWAKDLPIKAEGWQGKRFRK